ncbi:arginyltransferase [Litoribacillus peritrichatus]|uniref:arginyltransferase n=1 Tax=Litoribacillus peritrichatus TaxID=718191 RepID=UPI0031D586A1
MEIKLFQTTDTSCGYLEDRISSSLVVDPEIPLNQELVSWFSCNGFRRSGDMVYKPTCQHCNACKSCRVRVNEFKASSSQKRIRNKCKIANSVVREAAFSIEEYALFEKYISLRHSDGEMFPPSKDQYQSFLCKNYGFNYFLLTKIDEKIISVSVFDLLDDGLSAVYTFFDPEFDFLSPGVFSVLKLIDLAKQANLPYVYLGYWIKDCKKMSYKTKYQPIEIFDRNDWQQYTGN